MGFLGGCFWVVFLGGFFCQPWPKGKVNTHAAGDIMLDISTPTQPGQVTLFNALQVDAGCQILEGRAVQSPGPLDANISQTRSQKSGHVIYNFLQDFHR